MDNRSVHLFLKLINDLLSLNKENHNRIGGRVGNPILISTDFDDFISLFFSVFNDQIGKLYKTLERVFHQELKHFEVSFQPISLCLVL